MPVSQHGADVNRRNRDNLTCLDLVKDQEGELADLLSGDSALLDAAKKGHLKRVKKLVTSGNINCRDKHGRNSTPLHLSGQMMFLLLIMREMIMKLGEMCTCLLMAC